MPIKKSELYSSIWASCDELRGGMDASQYKDYVLVLLFVKYISDKYAGVPFAPITVPAGSSFADMVKLKGRTDIGDQINKKIMGPIAQANQISDVPDFNDATKLGSGKEMVDRLTKLIAIFENPNLDFSRNRADGDDILGDAYEFLMKHFATESGKSKGQFYTPAEVSRIMAKVIGIRRHNTTTQTTVYDPTCGSGSLLLKVADEAGVAVSLFGQEMDNTTAALARMNMILHNNPTAVIKQGNTIANPLFLDEQQRLKTFDYVVANPPFSYKAWSSGIDPATDGYGRFKDFGVPPEKNGDYAFLLHIIRSLKSTGKGAVILPHGVLFRGNAEAVIRKNLVDRGYIKGIIGLPANLFYGTGIPACIILVDKENAADRKDIIMVDASKGFLKDGNKNRLREQDIHRIVDVFTMMEQGTMNQVPGYARLVPLDEIKDPKNDYNLNLPRYIDSQEEEELQDIEAHLLGGIPDHDVNGFDSYWQISPHLKEKLFAPADRAGYWQLRVEKEEIKNTFLQDEGWRKVEAAIQENFGQWQKQTREKLLQLTPGVHPKEVIHEIAENLLHRFEKKILLDRYDLYQHLMNYWNDVLQDDLYFIAAEGWKAEVYRILVETKKGKTVDKGWACDLVPGWLVVNRYFATEKRALDEMEARKETLAAQLEELEEEHSGEEGFFADMEKVNKAAVQKRLKELKPRQKKLVKLKETTVATATEEDEEAAELKVLEQYMAVADELATLNAKSKQAAADLDKKVLAKYKHLNQGDIKTLVVDDKWLTALQQDFDGELQRIPQAFTQRVKELADLYETTLPHINAEVQALEEKVNAHLQNMGFVWS